MTTFSSVGFKFNETDLQVDALRLQDPDLLVVLLFGSDDALLDLLRLVDDEVLDYVFHDDIHVHLVSVEQELKALLRKRL